MRYCSNCGQAIDPKAVICPHCGTPVVSANEMTNQSTGSAWWGVLGFFVPVVGLVLFIVWQHEHPRSAKAAGIGALINVIISFIALILFIILWLFVIACIANS